MNNQTWIFGKAISPLFADRVTIIEYVSPGNVIRIAVKFGIHKYHEICIEIYIFFNATIVVFITNFTATHAY